MKIKTIGIQPQIDFPYEEATIQEAIEYCTSRSMLGLDIETTGAFHKYENEGLDPYLSKVVMLQIGDLECQYIIDTRYINPTELLNAVQDKLFVGHNLKFEYKMILHHYGVRLENLFDTMITEQVLYCGYKYKGYSLKKVNDRYKIGVELDKSDRNHFQTIGSKPFSFNLIEYGAKDIIAPLLIREKQVELVSEWSMRQCINLEMQFIKVLGDIELRGMHFNQDKWRSTYEHNLTEYQNMLKALDDYVVEHYSDTKFVKQQLDLFMQGRQCAIKWSSPKQVIEFFVYLGFCPKAKSPNTGKFGYTVESNELKKVLYHENFEFTELVKLYLDFSEKRKAVTTYGVSFFKYINPITQRLHSSYAQILVTGRISSRGPNLQNIPAGKEHRWCFDAPAGWKIINADYSGQESVVLANKSMDEELIDFYLTGEGDLHELTVQVKLDEFRGHPYGAILSQACSVKTA